MAGQKTPTALGTENIGKLLMQYAVPAIIAMTASSLYNMVDSIFIGHGVGTMAISGLALTFPLMNLAAAFGSLVGVGAATLISVKLGQKDYDTAQRVLGNVFVLNILLGVAFTVVVPQEGKLQEPDVEIELDEYRSYNRSKRSGLQTSK